MHIYFFVLVIFIIQIIIASLYKRNIKIKLNKVQFFLGTRELKLIFLCIDFWVLLFFAVLRDETVGTDYANYIQIFQVFSSLDYNSMSDNTYAEKGEWSFVILGYILNLLFSDYLFLVFGAYFIILFFVYKFIRRYADDVLLSGFLFFGFSFYNMSLNIMRQYIAAAIVLKAIDYIDKKPLKFFLLLIIAMTFHKTALIVAILYPILNYINNIRYSCIILLLVSGTVAVFSNDIMFFLGDIASYSSNYTTAGNEAEIDLKILVNIVVFSAFFAFSRQFCDWDKNGRKWIAMSAITLGLNLSALYFHSINRLFLYFMLPEIVSIPNFINSIEYGYLKFVLKIMLVVVFSLYYIFLVSSTACYDTVPYTSNILNIR